MEADGRDHGQEWLWNGGYPLRSSGDTEDDVKRVLAKLEATGNDHLLLRLVANSSSVFRPFVLLASTLLTRGELPAADRETLILHLAQRQNATFESQAHRAIALRAGVTARQIAALDHGKARQQSELFSVSQNLALRLGDQMLDRIPLAESDWDDAQHNWGPEGALEIVFTVAWWGGFVPCVSGALDLRLAEDESWKSGAASTEP